MGVTTGTPTLHVAFSPSFAGSLQYALTAAGRPDRIVRTFDDFSFGPIAPDDAAARARWVDEELRIEDWREVADRSEAVLAASRSTEGRIVAWLSHNVAAVTAGFLWWLSHIDSMPCHMVVAPSLPVMNDDKIAALIDREVPLWDAVRVRYRNHWEILKRENAALRVIRDGNLVSAPITHFDQALTGHVTRDWRKMARVVGGVLADQSEAGIYQTSDLFLMGRLIALAEDGALEWRGDLYHMPDCELRLPSSNAL
ncbi:MAG TPA: DUF3658 domain-containing protein [Sphingomonas sp.]|nr:DUF3658 domain-containing protein [Sphingomonas sp.]